MKNHVVEYYYTKKKESEYFVDQNGKLHREDGPAYISYYDNGSIKKQEYYLNGKEYDDMFKWLVAVGLLEV